MVISIRQSCLLPGNPEGTRATPPVAPGWFAEFAWGKAAKIPRLPIYQAAITSDMKNPDSVLFVWANRNDNFCGTDSTCPQSIEIKTIDLFIFFLHSHVVVAGWWALVPRKVFRPLIGWRPPRRPESNVLGLSSEETPLPDFSPAGRGGGIGRWVGQKSMSPLRSV